MDPVLLGQLCDDLGASETERARNSWIMDTLNVSLSFGTFEKTRTAALSSGSSAEGIERSLMGSDFDTMSVATNAMVTRDGAEVANVDFVFQAIPTNHPCFVVLKLVKADGLSIWDFSLHDITKRVGNCVILPSGQLTLVDLARHDQDMGVVERHGPAINIVVQGTDMDVIKSLPCSFWPDAAMIFLHYNGIYSEYHWPTLEHRLRIVRMGCHVVPKGNEQSQLLEHEWRYSFSLAEKMLVRLFSPTLFRCYFLMKMVLNFLIKPRWRKALSSYHIKTLMFHIAAKASPRLWVAANLSICLQRCLDQLLEFIDFNSCPHFFVPENNLFDSVDYRGHREALRAFVQMLCREGPPCLLRCAPLLVDAQFGCGHMQPRCPCFMRESLKDRLNRFISVYVNGISNVLFSFYGVLNFAKLQPDAFAAIVRLKRISRFVAQANEMYFPNRVQFRLVRNMIDTTVGFLSLAFPSRDNQQPRLSDDYVIQLCRDGCLSDFCAGKLKLACFLYMRGRLDLCVRLVYSILYSYDNAILPVTADKTRHESSMSRSRLIKVADNTRYVGDLELMMRKNVACPVVFINHEITFAPEEISHISSRNPTPIDEYFRGIVFIDSIVFALYLLIKCFNDQGHIRVRDLLTDKLREVVRHPDQWNLVYADYDRSLLERLQHVF